MEYYLALEALILGLGQHTEATVVDFYQKVLEFQIKSVLRLYSKSIARFGHDVLQSTDWKGLLKTLKSAEEQLYRDVLQSGSLSSQQKISELARSAVKNDEKMQLLLDSNFNQLEVQKDIRDYTKASAERQAEAQDFKVTEERSKCLQLFRLSAKASDRDESYEVFKKRNAYRVEGTCLWFLNHPNYKTWQHAKSGPLFVTADPGCGKSVLATYLIDEILTEPVCYFFFKDQVQARSNQALCALLHQLLSRTPELLELVLPEYRKNGEALVKNVTLLWRLLCQVIDNTIPVTVVLDGLDEWANEDRTDLMVDLRIYLSKTGAKFLLLSRPYEQVTSKLRLLLQDFPNIRIPGEDLSKEISPEIDLVIRARVAHLATELQLNDTMKTYIEQQLLKAPQRTYLWISLVLDYLKRDFKRTQMGFDMHLKQLPLITENIYEATLERCNSGIDPTITRIIFSILLAAKDVLSITELQVATEFGRMAVTESPLDAQFEDIKDFERTLRQKCGLLVTVLDGNVYFLHQTVREFLLGPGNPNGWQASFSLTQTNDQLAEICIDYLGYLNKEHEDDPRLWPHYEDLEYDFDKGYESAENDESDQTQHNPSDHKKPVNSRPQGTVVHGFVYYAFCYWFQHYRDYKPSNARASIMHQKAIKVFSTELALYKWFPIFRHPLYGMGATELMVAANYGLHDLISHCLQYANINQQDSRGLTALHHAINAEEFETAAVLLDHGASVDIPELTDKMTALQFAVRNRFVPLAMRMIPISTNLNLQDAEGYTALHHAIDLSQFHIATSLLDHGAAVDVQIYTVGMTALHFAIERDIPATDITIRLINSSNNLDLSNNLRQTALHTVVLKTTEGSSQPFFHWKDKIISELQRCGADMNARDFKQETVLHSAARRSSADMMTLLLTKGASISARNEYGQTPLHLATLYGPIELMQLLVSHHNYSEMIEVDSLSLLIHGIASMSVEKLEYLFSIGCRAKGTDRKGRTILHRMFDVPLYHADLNLIKDAFEKILLTVLSYGIDLNSTDNEGSVPLISVFLFCRRDLWLCDDRPGGAMDTIVRAFIKAGADLTIRNKEGKTAWWYAWTASDTGMRNMFNLLMGEEKRQRARLEGRTIDLPDHNQSNERQSGSQVNQEIDQEIEQESDRRRSI